MSVRARIMGWSLAVVGLAAVVFVLLTWKPPSRHGLSGLPPTAGVRLFEDPGIGHFEVEIPEAGLAALRQDPRKDVPAKVRFAGVVYEAVEVHLKGATGSFRPVEEKPSLTLKFAGAGPAGQRKIHLNNSVEDSSLMHEYLGSRVFRAAGVPAARTTHALVSLNGRRLGLYVVKEGFTEAFVRQHWSVGGNFYEPVQAQDIQGDLEVRFGKERDSRAGLRELAAATAEPDLARRWEFLGTLLDREAFATFMAAEVLLGHRDGYSLARNNYRLYHDPATGRLHFLPHGLDNLLGKPDFPWLPYWRGQVARAFMETPEGRALYRAKLEYVVTHVFPPEELKALVRERAALLAKHLGRTEARALQQAVADLCGRIEARHTELLRQLSQPPPSPLAFTNGIATLTQWRAVDAPAGGQMAVTVAPDGRRALTIKAGPRTAASWRTTVVLEPGLYTFEGEVMLRGVLPLPFGRNQGAGLGVQEVELPPHRLTGNADWRRLQVDFTVPPPGRALELRCEFMAREGMAWFALDSLRLRQRGAGPGGG